MPRPRRIALLTPAVIAPALALSWLTAAPAHAATNVICVGAPAGVTCNQTFATIPLAISAATTNTLDDTIRIAPGTYNDGPYQIDGSAHAITLQGSGPSTVVTLAASPNSQTYIIASHAEVRDLKVTMASASSGNDTGLSLSNGAVADHVTVDGAGTDNARGVSAGGSTMSNLVVTMPTDPAGGSRAVYSSGTNTVTDSTLTASTAFLLSDPGTTDHVSRVSLRADYFGVLTDGGNVVIDDAVIDLGTSGGAGIGAANFNNSTSPKTITANHVTIVGGGANSKGAWAFAAATGAMQTTTLNLANSIVRGPATSLVADASNTLSPGNISSGTLNVSYSDFQTTGGTVGANGAGGVVQGAGNLNVDPGFVGAGNYHLTSASPVVDKGDPAAGGPATDRDGAARVSGTRRDMGAYELPQAAPPVVVSDTTAPDTGITKKPKKHGPKAKVKFVFSATEAGATFQCHLDKKPWKACTATYKVTVKVGKHTMYVRAVDAAGNIDQSPKKFTFTRSRTK